MNSNGYGPNIVTVATNLPRGKTRFDRAGVSESAEMLVKYARSLPGCPDDIEAVSAASVDLEWRYEETGRKIGCSDKWQAANYVIITPLVKKSVSKSKK